MTTMLIITRITKDGATTETENCYSKQQAFAHMSMDCDRFTMHTMGMGDTNNTIECKITSDSAYIKNNNDEAIVYKIVEVNTHPDTEDEDFDMIYDEPEEKPENTPDFDFEGDYIPFKTITKTETDIENEIILSVKNAKDRDTALKLLNEFDTKRVSTETWNSILQKSAELLKMTVNEILEQLERLNAEKNKSETYDTETVCELEESEEAKLQRELAEEEAINQMSQMLEDAEDPIHGCDPYAEY